MCVCLWTCASISSNLTCYSALYNTSEEELNCLRGLYTSDYERHKDRNPKRTPGTCEWVFDHPEYLNWESKNTSSLLWVSADPGCGKSVLASFLVDKFKSSESQEILPCTVCFFFFKDDSDEQDNAISAVSAILHQLFSAKYELIKHALQKYKTKGKKMFEELRSLWNIFMSAATDPTSKNVICVIDGLDECQNPSRDELIQLLSEFCANSARQGEERTRMKILLLGRPYSFIEDALHHPLTIRMKMEDESDLTSADVELVIRNRVSRFGSKRNISDQVQTRLIDRLISQAGQTFLWASLVLAELESSPRASETKMVELINQIPTTLYAVYEKILGKSQSPKDARKILHIIVGAVRPLSLAEMNIAFVIKPEDRDYVDLDLEPAIETTIRNLCGLFVKVIDSKIYLVHQTARDFLISINSTRVRDLNAWQNSLDPLQADIVLTQICTSYLMLEVFEEQPLLFYGKSPERVRRYLEKHYFLDYTATNWALHFRKVQSVATSIVVESVLNICNTHSKRFQTWFRIFARSEDLFRYFAFDRFPEYTSLHVASFCGWDTIVSLLLEKGMDINARSSSNETSLMLAISRGHDAVTKLLLEKGANLQMRNIFADTALDLAVRKGNESVIRLLFEMGAEVNAIGTINYTKLHLAVVNKDECVVRLLLENGALPDAQNYGGNTALHLAVENGCESVTRLLFENNANPDLQNNQGNTALHWAVENECESVTKLLLENGPNPDLQNNRGDTALHLAVEYESYSVLVKLLFEYNANPDVQNHDGDTALHLAVEDENEPAIRLLLERNALTNIYNLNGETALGIARRKRYPEITRLLIQHGADPDL